MANQECPKCKTTFSTHDGWAKSAIATLIAAPAVPDMATQVRCPKCGYVFGESEVRYLQTGPTTAVWLFVVGLFLWAIYQFIWA